MYYAGIFCALVRGEALMFGLEAVARLVPRCVWCRESGVPLHRVVCDFGRREDWECDLCAEALAAAQQRQLGDSLFG